MDRSRPEFASVKFRFSSAGDAVVATARDSLSSWIFNLRHFLHVPMRVYSRKIAQRFSILHVRHFS